MKKNLKRDGSIGKKVSVILLASILISTCTVGIFCYYSYRENALELAGQRAEAIAYSIAPSIDGERFTAYGKTGQKDDYFNLIEDMMIEVKKNSGAAYVYSMADDGENYKYIMSGDGDFGESDPKSLYQDVTAVYENGISCYSEASYDGPEYGMLISGYAPVFDSKGQVAGVVGVDIGVNEVIAKVNAIIPVLVAMILITSALLFMLSYAFINRTVSKPLKGIAQKSKLLLMGDTDLQIDKKHLDRTDEIGLIARGLDEITQNTKMQAEAAKKIAAGDLSIDITAKSEKDILAISISSVIDTLKRLVAEGHQMGAAALEGRLESRGDSDQFEGGYKDIIDGFNKTLDAVIKPLNMSAEYIERISKGDIPQIITEDYPGDYNEIKDSINTCIRAINSLISDTRMLSDAAVEGELKTRADALKHGGDFARIIEGVNQTLDSVVEPLDKAAEYMRRIGNGEIPEKITEDYKGDFNNIKNSINACIEGLGGLEEGRDILGNMANNDYNSSVEGSYLGIYCEIADSINTVGNNIKETIVIMNHIAQGDLTDLDRIKQIGRKSDQDSLVPAMITMMENISMMYEETDLLWQAAMDGRLDFRGDQKKFKGKFEEIIEGINETMDAVTAPIQETLSVLREMAGGNLQIRVNGEYKGEYEEIKETVNETIGNLRSYVNEISGVLSEIGSGNLDLEITADYKGDFVEIKDSLNRIITSLNEIMRDINDAAEQVAI